MVESAQRQNGSLSALAARLIGGKPRRALAAALWLAGLVVLLGRAAGAVEAPAAQPPEAVAPAAAEEETPAPEAPEAPAAEALATQAPAAEAPAAAEAAAGEPAETPAGRVFYVRQTVGDNSNDGLSPQTAWAGLLRLSTELRAGDTAYIGPGLYRESIVLRNGGTPDARIFLIADTSGRHTGDPPGPVLLTGAEPVDESIFEPHTVAGVYRAPFDAFKVLGVVEMDGNQRRLAGVLEPVGETPYLERVETIPGTYYHDREAGTLYVHTSDGEPPSAHELELIRLYGGAVMVDKPHVTVAGFTFRHYGDSGVSFRFSPYGVVVDVTSFGSRQGIRVRDSDHVMAAGNTLFRNENSGIYFVQGSKAGTVVGNHSYENVKGIRWSSNSINGVALDNVLNHNLETGLSVEKANHALLRGNRLVGNEMYQLMLLKTSYDSDGNCFERRDPSTPMVLFYPYQSYATLEAYRAATGQDRASREGSCGPLPEKVDVHRLHAESLAYAERARASLEAAALESAAADGAD